MTLYVRRRTKWITFVHSVQELREFCAAYIPGQSPVLGDISRFNKQMRNILLRFLEHNPSVDCYSSEDIPAGALLSRFSRIEKELEPLGHTPSDDSFLQSPRGAQDAEIHLTFQATGKLLATGCTDFEFTLLKTKYGAGN